MAPRARSSDRCSNHIWPIRGYGLYPLALRSAHRRTRRGPFRAVVLHMSACSTTTIGGIVIFFPAGYPFSNHTRRVGSYFRIAITSAEREKSFTGTRPTFDEGLQPRRTFLRTLYRQNVIADADSADAALGLRRRGPAFSESLRFDDWEMWLRIAVRFDVGFLDVYDADYRIHTAQTTHEAFGRMGEHRLEFLDEVDRWLPPVIPRSIGAERGRGHTSGLRTTHSGEESGADRPPTPERVSELPGRGTGSEGGRSGVRGVTVSSTAASLWKQTRQAEAALDEADLTRRQHRTFAPAISSSSVGRARSSVRSMSTDGLTVFRSCRRC